MKPNQLNPVTYIFTGLFVLYLVLSLEVLDVFYHLLFCCPVTGRVRYRVSPPTLLTLASVMSF